MAAFVYDEVEDDELEGEVGSSFEQLWQNFAVCMVWMPHWGQNILTTRFTKITENGSN